jgi:hypothetical protein
VVSRAKQLRSDLKEGLFQNQFQRHNKRPPVHTPTFPGTGTDIAEGLCN